MSNLRAWLHALNAGLAAIAGGTVIFSGLDADTIKLIVGICALTNIILGSYLSSTSSGVTVSPFAKDNS